MKIRVYQGKEFQIPEILEDKEIQYIENNYNDLKSRLSEYFPSVCIESKLQPDVLNDIKVYLVHPTKRWDFTREWDNICNVKLDGYLSYLHEKNEIIALDQEGLPWFIREYIETKQINKNKRNEDSHYYGLIAEASFICELANDLGMTFQKESVAYYKPYDIGRNRYFHQKIIRRNCKKIDFQKRREIEEFYRYINSLPW